MKQLVTEAIILSRTDYGEADRILTVLTPDHGKLRFLAKGVRRVKSKLAGGIELFSVSAITYGQGRGELGTLVSSRLITHYGHIVNDLDRTMLGYDLIKQLNKITEDEPEPAYFHLLRQAFEALDDEAIPLAVIRLWFSAQLVRLGGLEPNLVTDVSGQKLQANETYEFSYDSMSFGRVDNGHFTPGHIKLLRLVFADTQPKNLQKIANVGQLVDPCERLTQHLYRLIY